MSALGNLVVSLIMETAAFTKGIDKSTNEAQKFAKEMDQKVNKAIQTAAGNMKSFAGNALGAIGAVTTVAAAFSKLDNTFQRLDAAVKQSQSLGIPIQQMTALQFAAKLSGVEVDKFGDGLKDLNKNITEAAGGSKSQAEMFKALGISVVDASGKVRSTQDILLDLSEKFAEFRDGPEKSAAAMKLFGDSGIQLIPFLNQGREGIQDLTTEAARLGVVMDEQTAKAAEQFGDDLSRLNAISDALFMNIAQDLLPRLTSLTETMLDATNASNGLGESIATLLNGAISTGSLEKKIADLEGQLGKSSIVDLGSEFLFQERQSQIRAQIAFYNTQLEKQSSAADKASRGVKALTGEVDKNTKANEKAGETALERMVRLARESADRENTARVNDKLEKERLKRREENFRLEKEIQDMFADVLQDEADRNDEAKKRAEALAKENQVMREQIEEIGLSSEALLGLRQRRLEDAAASKEQAAAKLEGRAGYDFEIQQLKEEARLLRERAGLLELEDSANQSNAAREAAIALRDENQKVFDQFSDGMIEAFGKVRLEGESLADSLARAFESEFEKLILRPVIKAAFQGGDIGSAIGKGFDTYNEVFNRAFTNPLGTAGVSAASSFAMSGVGRSLGLSESAMYSALDGATGDLTAAGLQFTQAAAVIGKAAPYFSAVSNALSGNYGASIGAGIGAYFGGPAGAFIGEMIGDKLLGGLFGGNKISAQNLSADQLKPISDAVTLGFTDFIKMFEGTGTADFMLSGNTGRQGENPNFTLSTDGYSSRSRFGGDGLFAQGEIALNEQNVAEEVTRAMFAALQRSDFTDNIDKLFDSIDPVTASIAELNFALEGARVLDAVNDNFGKLSGNLAALSGASLQTLQAFSNAVGGFENLGNSVAQFNQQFLSEDERLRLEIDLLSSTVKQLGVEVPLTRDEFRKLVDAQDLTQQAGIRAYGSLLQMSGAVDQVFDQLEARAEKAAEESRRAAEKAAEDARRLADEEANKAQAIASQRLGLENQILQLMGDTATLRERELAALEPANRYLQAHIFALQDAARAQDERNRALEAEQSAVARLAESGRSIKEVIDSIALQITGLPSARSMAADAIFKDKLELARKNDPSALGSIGKVALDAIEAARESSSSFLEFQRKALSIRSDLQGLPAVKTFEQQLLEALFDLKTGFNKSIIDSYGLIKGSFDQFDSNLNGLLTFDELKIGLAGKATDAEIRFIIQALDQNLDRALNQIEVELGERLGATGALRTAIANGFDLLDRSANGLLDFSELKAGLAGIATDAQLKAIFAELDVNGDGVISQLEALNGKSQSLAGAIKDSLSPLFGRIDTSVNGLISPDEFAAAFGTFGLGPKLELLRTAFDFNNDRQISAIEALGSKVVSGNQLAKNAIDFGFSMLDTSVDGLLNFDELKSGLGAYIKDTDIVSLLREIDKDGNGQISAIEAQTARISTLAGEIKNNLAPLFDSVDLNFSGGITKDEFSQVFGGLGLGQKLDSIFRELDINGDGTISRLEAGNRTSDQILGQLAQDSILKYSASDVKAAYTHGGKTLSNWLADIAYYGSLTSSYTYATSERIGSAARGLTVSQHLAGIGDYTFATQARIGGAAAGYPLSDNLRFILDRLYGVITVQSFNRQGPSYATFASGGLVTGPGTSTSDSIPAYLSNNEFVMKSASVQKFGRSFMESINEGNFPMAPAMMMGFDMKGVISELRSLRTEVAQLRSENRVIGSAMVDNTGRAYRLLEDVTTGAERLVTVVESV